MRNPLSLAHAVMTIFVTIYVGRVDAQSPGILTDAPNTHSGAGGASAVGLYSLERIETVNSSNGNVSLSIPAAHLPPGPGGFSAGVSLVYNSAIFDLRTEVPTNNATFLQMSYVPSAHGGGWNYNYKFTLWSETRVTTFNSATCSAVTQTDAKNWYKTILTTPDGGNHVLRLVGALNTSGNPIAGAPTSDASSFAQYDFGGYTNLNCGLSIPRFSGTLIFATGDSSFLRVEANTVTNTWTAYLPNATQVSGPINLTNQPHAFDSDVTQIVDRNGNTLTVSGNCAVGTACTEMLLDLQGRNIKITYASNAAGTWTDNITWPGANGNVTTVVNWSSAPPFQLPYRCQANLSGIGSAICSLAQTASVVSSVQLPAASNGGNAVNFTMDYGPPSGSTYSWGELHHLTLCTGASPSNCQPQWAAHYTYIFDTSNSLPNSADPGRPPGTSVNPIAKKIVHHVDTLSGSATPLDDTTQYYVPLPTSPYSYPVTASTINVDQVTLPDGSFTETFTANLCPASVKSRDLCVAVPYKIFKSDGSSVEMMWTSNAAAPGVPAGALFNPYVQYRVETPVSGGPVRITYAQQDQNGNTTSIREYDWQPASVVTRDTNTGVITSVCSQGCTAVRTRTTAFYTGTGQAYWVHGAPLNLRSPQSVTVGNAVTTYSYDNALTTANLTQMDQFDDATSTNISSSWTYLANGNVQSQTDPNNFGNSNGARTLFCYDGSNLYPVKRVVGATNLSCPTPSKVTEAQTTTFDFNFNSGMPNDQKDTDNNVTTTYTYDNIGRRIKIEQNGGGLDRVTSTNYDDVNLTVTTTQDDTVSNKLVTTTTYDALGRLQAISDGVGNQVQKAYRYGASGLSYELSSNPFKSTSDSTMGWMLTSRDANHDQVSVTHYSGNVLPAPFGVNTSPTATGTTSVTANVTVPGNVTGCAGTATSRTDEAGYTHTSCQDGLGRVTAVIEPDNAVSNYFYDVLNNLTGVTVSGQSTASCAAGQLRCFSYSSLSRPTSSTNPESGTATYGQYDKNGNLKQMTDAMGIVTTMGYDSLNRVTSKSYSVPNGSTIAVTAPVFNNYDQDYKGALSSVCSQSCIAAANTVITSYTHDAFGRVTGSAQTMGTSSPYPFTYQYSLTDQLTQITYPSGRQVGYVLDAADRVQIIQNVNTAANYASLNYTTAPGNTLTMTMGNGVTEKPSFNDRLQPTGLQVNSSAGNLLTLGLFPCPGGLTACASGNNGNLQSQTITIANPGLSVTQTYGYDSLNRLTSATENNGGNWTQNYSYVGNGNRWASSAGLPALTLETPQGPDWYTTWTPPAGCAPWHANQINGWCYDANGNVRQIGNTIRSFTYDAENRQVSANISGVIASYGYDGFGQRVSKTVSGVTTTYVYDAFGNLAAEYGSTDPSPCGTATCYATVDHLGSTRMLTDATGSSNVRRYDYQPFGAEIPAGYGGRTSLMGYLASADPFGTKFTGQFRDSETGLDWFNVRHMSGAQGRFQSVDPGNAGVAIGAPQTWNAYAYVGNNPLSYTDPSGECWWCTLLGIGLDIAGLFTGGTTTILGTILTTGGTVLAGGGTLGSIIGGIGGGGLPGIGGIGGNPGDIWNEQLPWATSATNPLGVPSTGFPGIGGTIGIGTGNGPWGEQLPGSNGFLPGLVPVAAGAGVGEWVIGGGLGVLCVGSGVCEAIAIGAAVAAVGTGVYLIFKEHTKGARPSKTQTHEEGQARAARDYGAEKGDKPGTYPRKQPPDWKTQRYGNKSGAWPPKTARDQAIADRIIGR